MSDSSARSFKALAEQADQTGGFLHDLGPHVLAFLPGQGSAAGTLAVSFGNLATSRQSGEQFAWAQALLERQGWSVLGVINNVNDWFRGPSIQAAMEDLARRGFFNRFDRVVTYGASMGGFGALTFAPLYPGCHAVVFAPQSTLDRRRAPFETRYRYARRIHDWTGPRSDAAEGVGAVGSGYLIHDPFERQDAAHVARLAAPALRPVKLRHFGHQIPPRLQRMGLLKPLAVSALHDRLDPVQVTALLAGRHNSVRYLTLLLEGALNEGHFALGLRAADAALKRHDNWKIRRLRKMLRAAHQQTRNGG